MARESTQGKRLLPRALSLAAVLLCGPGGTAPAGHAGTTLEDDAVADVVKSSMRLSNTSLIASLAGKKTQGVDFTDLLTPDRLRQLAQDLRPDLEMARTKAETAPSDKASAGLKSAIQNLESPYAGDPAQGYGLESALLFRTDLWVVSRWFDAAAKTDEERLAAKDLGGLSRRWARHVSSLLDAYTVIADRHSKLLAQVNGQRNLMASYRVKDDVLAQAEHEKLDEKASEQATRGALGAMRAALSIMYGDLEGLYPFDLWALTEKQAYLTKIIQAVTRRHPPSNLVTYYSSGQPLKDTGGWGYVADPSDADVGKLFVDCTHTDSHGKAWSSY